MTWRSLLPIWGHCESEGAESKLALYLPAIRDRKPELLALLSSRVDWLADAGLRERMS
jgi:hypothetical protein